MDDFVLVYLKKYEDYANQFEQKLIAKYNIRKLGKLETSLKYKLFGTG